MLKYGDKFDHTSDYATDSIQKELSN